jgi:hypothetical protein
VDLRSNLHRCCVLYNQQRIIYMNSLSIIILAILLVSCNNIAEKKSITQPPENSKSIEVQLVDSLGIINLSVPLRYDTSFSWVHHSDCGKPCDEQKYRFQSKELPITKETGWIWLGKPKDSIDRFTISHSGYFPFHDGDTTKNIVSHNQMKVQLKSAYNLISSRRGNTSTKITYLFALVRVSRTNCL